jgi:hypothetical protein
MRVITLDNARKLFRTNDIYVGEFEVQFFTEMGLVGHPPSRITHETIKYKVVPNNYEYDHGQGD